VELDRGGVRFTYANIGMLNFIGGLVLVRGRGALSGRVVCILVRCWRELCLCQLLL
jgi:hypothetical protein